MSRPERHGAQVLPTAAAIHELAAGQHGVVTRSQLLAAGFSPRSVDSRLARGSLFVWYPSVYAVGRRDLPIAGQRLAAVLACGAEASLSYRSAAALHGQHFDRMRGWDVSIGRGHGGQRGPGLIRLHHLRTMAASDVIVVDGVRVTTPSRTLVDLASVLSYRQLRKAVHETEVSRLLDVREVGAITDRMPRRRGVRMLRALLGVSAAEPTNSEFIVRFLDLCERFSLPAPKANVYMDDGGALLRETDLLYEREKLIVELDGVSVHMTRQRFEADRRRDVAFLARGFATVRVTWTRLTDDGPALASELRTILDARRPRSPTQRVVPISAP